MYGMNDTCCNASFALRSQQGNVVAVSLQVLAFQFVYQQVVYGTNVPKTIGMYRLKHSGRNLSVSLSEIQS
jgi:hypothetical protein